MVLWLDFFYTLLNLVLILHNTWQTQVTNKCCRPLRWTAVDMLWRKSNVTSIIKLFIDRRICLAWPATLLSVTSHDQLTFIGVWSQLVQTVSVKWSQWQVYCKYEVTLPFYYRSILKIWGVQQSFDKTVFVLNLIMLIGCLVRCFKTYRDWQFSCH